MFIFITIMFIKIVIFSSSAKVRLDLVISRQRNIGGLAVGPMVSMYLTWFSRDKTSTWRIKKVFGRDQSAFLLRSTLQARFGPGAVVFCFLERWRRPVSSTPSLNYEFARWPPPRGVYDGISLMVRRSLNVSRLLGHFRILSRIYRWSRLGSPFPQHWWMAVAETVKDEQLTV